VTRGRAWLVALALALRAGGVEGRSFEQRAVRVEDPVEIARLVRPGLRKLGAASLGVYRLEDPSGTGGAP
jgi:hypothetical protein